MPTPIGPMPMLSPTTNELPPKSVRLSVQDLSHVPSFKNCKRAILDSKTGQMRTLTEPKVKRWMRKCTDAFVCQLRSLYQTTEGAMPMARSLRCWTVYVAPLDDSVNHIPEIHIKVVHVAHGKEGAVIEIEPL